MAINYNTLNNTNINNQQNFGVDSEEIAVYLPEHGLANDDILKVHIEATMAALDPRVKLALPTTWREGLNKNIYINDKDCRPTVAMQRTFQNYRSLRRQDNRMFACTYFKHGDKMKVASWNGDHDLMYITTKLDMSHDEC